MTAHGMAIYFPKLSKSPGIFLIHLSLLFLCYIQKALNRISEVWQQFAGQWMNICSCRCLPLGAGCCFRALGCSLLGCCGGNRWLYCGSSGYLLYSFWGWWSGDKLSLEPWWACQAWQHLDDIHECGLVLICTQLHQWLWRCRNHDQLHILQWQGATVSCHCLIQKQNVLHRLGLFCSNLYGHG